MLAGGSTGEATGLVSGRLSAQLSQRGMPALPRRLPASLAALGGWLWLSVLLVDVGCKNSVGKAAHRLVNILGLSELLYLRVVRRCNTVDRLIAGGLTQHAQASRA